MANNLQAVRHPNEKSMHKLYHARCYPFQLDLLLCVDKGGIFNNKVQDKWQAAEMELMTALAWLV